MIIQVIDMDPGDGNLLVLASLQQNRYHHAYTYLSDHGHRSVPIVSPSFLFLLKENKAFKF